MTGALRLRPLLPHDEGPALTAHAALAEEGFAFLLGLDPAESWLSYLQRLRDNSRGLNVARDWVPATFLAATLGGELVGRISIRHELNDFLAAYGGHIGYAVVPGHRRRGHATTMLSQGLVIARSLGIDRVLVTCDDDNSGSARAIESNGGVLESVVDRPGSPVPLRRYWIC